MASPCESPWEEPRDRSPVKTFIRPHPEKEISLLYEGKYSICGNMDIPLSEEDQNPWSLIEGETYSHIDEENVHERIHNVVILEEDPSPHGDERGSIASMGGFLVSEGDEDMYDGLLREISRLCEGPSSIFEVMEVLPSRDDQDLGSLLDDEVISLIDGEDEHMRSNNAVILGGDPSPHGGEKGAIASIRGALVSLQGVPNDSTCGNQGTILEPYVAFARDCETEEKE